MQRLRGQAADLLEAGAVARRAPRQLDQRVVGEHVSGRAVHRAGHALAPLDQLERHAAGTLAEPAEPRQPLEHARGVALVGRLLERAALLARPVEPAALVEPALDLLAEREQQARVVGRVLELLRRERAAGPTS